MGASSTKDVASRPLIFGTAGELGVLLGVYHDHNITTPRAAGEASRSAVISVSRNLIDVWSPINGDRRARIRSPGLINCCDYAMRSTVGPVVLIGTGGEVYVNEMLTYSPFKSFRTAEIGVPPHEQTGIITTAVLCHPAMKSLSAAGSGDDTFFAGNSDGSVVSIKIMTGEVVHKFSPGTGSLDEGPANPLQEVSAMTMLMSQRRPILAVAHSDGVVHTYDASSAQFLSNFRVPPKTKVLVAASNLDAILAAKEESKDLVVWDATSSAALKLDFSGELDALKKSSVTMTSMAYDDARSLLFSGASDGSVFVRRLDRTPTGSFGVKLLRFCNPSSSASTPSRVTSLYFASSLDRLYTGDMSGLTRLVKRVTGIKYEDTDVGATASSTGQFRPRGPSDVGVAGGEGGIGAGAGAGAGGGPLADEGPAAAPPLPEPERWSLEWAEGTVEVSSLGGMVVPKFVVPGGQQVSPLFVAPWSRDPDAARLPPVLQALRGEYTCAPFGSARPVVGLTSEWERCKHEESDGPFAGHGANSTWTLESKTDSSIVICCEYPGHHAIKLLRKRISADGSQVKVSVEIEARSTTRVPVGFSTMFAVSPRAGATTLAPGAFEFGSVFPGAVEPAGSATWTLSPGASFESLKTVPRRVPPGPGVGGGNGADTPQDLSELPLADTKVEAIVQLCGADGIFNVIRHDLGCTFSLRWDANVLPSAVVRVSNNGRKYYPWSGAHSSVTVSPAASAFDLGTTVSAGDNPLSTRGFDTAVEVSDSAPLRLDYVLAVTKGTVAETTTTTTATTDAGEESDEL